MGNWRDIVPGTRLNGELHFFGALSVAPTSTFKTSDEQNLRKWALGIARIGTHNAYHVGQIVYVRKAQGSWNPMKGVK